MNYILFDDQRIQNLLPFTYTRPVSEIRCGIMTMKERWDFLLSAKASYLTADHLQGKFPLQTASQNIWINSGYLATPALAKAIMQLEEGQGIAANNQLIARNSIHRPENLEEVSNCISWTEDVKEIRYPWDIFSMNDFAIRADFEMLTQGKMSMEIPDGNQIIGKDIFIEPGAKINASIINTTTGPVYIGKDAEIMEGCIVRGPLALGEGSVLKMGAKIYGATTIGKGSKVGGEVNNSVLFANSNKAHDGFLGNAVIGEWCNLGADTNNSNLKNNYEEVKLWSEHKGSFVKTGLQFCGLMMGDHSKCGINTMFNTGTVVGVSCNIYGAGFPRNFIPSFSWGSANGFMDYQLNKAIDTAKRVFDRRHLEFNEHEQNIFSHVFEVTKTQRTY